MIYDCRSQDLMRIEAQGDNNIPHQFAATQPIEQLLLICRKCRTDTLHFLEQRDVYTSQRRTRHPRGFSTLCSDYKYSRAYDVGSRKLPRSVARKLSEVIFAYILATER